MQDVNTGGEITRHHHVFYFISISQILFLTVRTDTMIPILLKKKLMLGKLNGSYDWLIEEPRLEYLSRVCKSSIDIVVFYDQY